MSNTILSQIGYGFLGFSFCQFMAFLGSAYPKLAKGSFFVLALLFFTVVVLGIFHWVTLRKQGYRGDDHLLIGFMPLWIIGGFFFLALFGGLSLGGF